MSKSERMDQLEAEVRELKERVEMLAAVILAVTVADDEEEPIEAQHQRLMAKHLLESQS